MNRILLQILGGDLFSLPICLSFHHVEHESNFAEDWVEEIRFLSANLSLSFRHVDCESNFVADSLAKFSASHTELAFDV